MKIAIEIYCFFLNVQDQSFIINSIAFVITLILVGLLLPSFADLGGRAWGTSRTSHIFSRSA